MATYTDTRLITLSSDYAKKYNNGSMLSDVEYQFVGMLKDELDIVRTDISVISAELPVSFYNITTTNNTLVYGINGGSLITITIPVGNYNANSLISYLNPLFLASNIVMSISSITGKITLAFISGSGTIQYNLASTTGTILGFIPKTSYSGASLIPPYPMNLLGVKRISICSDLLPVYVFTSVSAGLGNILMTIDVDKPPFGLLLYKNLSNIRSKLRISRLDYFDIKIKDEFNNFIDFNNCSWTITLVMDIIRISKTTPSLALDLNDLKPALESPPSLDKIVKPIGEFDLLTHQSENQGALVP